MYYVVYGLLYILSLLPLQVLYLFSDLAFFLIYYVFKYRREVVKQNLLQAFPEKTEQERKKIAKQYFRNFADSFIEVLKMLSTSRKFMRRHFTGDFSIFNSIYNQGKRCQYLLGHHFNWEVGCIGLPLYLQHLPIIIYMPVSNKIFDRLMKHIRTRIGAILVPATDMHRSLLRFRNERYTLVLVADQNPGEPSESYWINFFGKPTPFVKAPESGAKRSNMPVVFGQFKRIKRGYYCGEYILATKNPSELPPGELTILYVRFLEQSIRGNPDNWLWSHKRWKHKWKEEYGPVLG